MVWFSTLTYPVERPYRIRWITEFFYFGSAILVILLVVFNVALVGYEEVIAFEKDPNITDYDQWWAPKTLPSALRFRTKPGECQVTTLPLNTPLRTNSSLPLFTYNTINNVENIDAQKDAFGLRSETPYQANPMDICHVQDISITMEPRILAFVVETTLLCDPVGDPPRARRFQTQFKRAQDSRLRPDSILEYMAYRAPPNETNLNTYEKFSRNGPPKDSYLNALGVVDALCTDLVHLMWMRKMTFPYVNDSINTEPPETGYLVWDPSPDSRSPTNYSRFLEYQTYSNGEWFYDADYLLPMNVTIIDLFVAIRDAIYLDIGNIVPSNIYTNKTSFNSMIQIDQYSTELNRILFEHKDWRELNNDPTCSWGWGCTSSVNVTWAEALTSTNKPTNNITLPVVLPSDRTASVIDIVYLCPKYKLKPLGNMLMSVFVGTFTMYVTCYGIFAWIAPALDRKHDAPNFPERFNDQPALAPSYELRSGSMSSRTSNATPPYHTIEFEYDQKRLLDEHDERDS